MNQNALRLRVGRGLGRKSNLTPRLFLMTTLRLFIFKDEAQIAEFSNCSYSRTVSSNLSMLQHSS